jgi:Zn-dependent M28 family amino/carboxypeptidase
VHARFDGTNALEEVRRFLQVGPRAAGTDGARRAAAHLRERLAAHGVGAEVDEFLDAVPGGTGVFRNVIGRIPGAQPGLVVLGAHYDTKDGVGPGFEGANDSGSGVGVLLEIARLVGRSPWPGPSLWLAFLDGEECRVSYGPRDGLHGSRRLAAQLTPDPGGPAPRAVIVVDMVGDRDLGVMLPENRDPALTAAILAAARELGVRETFSLLAVPVLDDHEPFRLAGMPAVDLIDFQYGSAPGRNDYWHTPQDTFDKLSADSLATVGRVVLRALERL